MKNITEYEATMFATAKQKRKIAQLCMALGLRERLENTIITSREACDLIRELSTCVKADKEKWCLGNRHISVRGIRNDAKTIISSSRANSSADYYVKKGGYIAY